MSEESTLIGRENIQTIVAVAFILAALSLVLNFYNFRRTNVATAGLSGADAGQVSLVQRNHEALVERIDALEADMKAAKAEMTAQKAAAAQQAAAEPEPEAAP